MRSTAVLAAGLAALPALRASPVTLYSRQSNSTANCFPYGTAQLPTDGSAPDVSLDDWWCPQSMAYGFQGFSYPMEDADCSDGDNGADQLNNDFAQMKRDFGATVVRMYYPQCLDKSVFLNAVQAAINNNMGLIFQVWTNFGNGDQWQQSQQAIYDALEDAQYKDVIPYVVHWADFGSEPVGDGMAGDDFLPDLADFRAKINSYGILAGISEDWDRPGIMSSDDGSGAYGLGSGLGPTGQGVQSNSDYAHIHPMPYYHNNDPESDAWAYIQAETLWVKQYVNLPIFITESPWGWEQDSHNPGRSDQGVSQYTDYWQTFDNNCEWMRDNNVGWFLHAWNGEDAFDILYDDGSYVIPNWRPRVC